MSLPPLPIDAWIEPVRQHVVAARAVVVAAAPGAGKTTRVPPALLGEGPVLVLQPRRVAARAVARRIAEERGWRLGREVGWHIRFERRFSSDTCLLVVTEGILTARLQQDPLLSAFSTVVFDEFHERSIHADLGLALARQAWLARDDLRLVVMSATLDVERAAAFFGGCPIVRVPGATHPLMLEHAPGEDVADAVESLLPRTPGNILCFLPGAREIVYTQQQLEARSHRWADRVSILPLHGSLDAEAQDRVMTPTVGRRVILATNIAETSLTVPGVTAVVDSGLVKVARYDAIRGVDRLETERVTRDSADQRAGRAARLGPGITRRLWSETERLRPHQDPDIARIDLAGPVLDLLAWGGDPRTFDWFEAPGEDRLSAALAVLLRLGAVEMRGDKVSLTTSGRTLQRLPLPPRLGRILSEADGALLAIRACALLAEGARAAATGAVTMCDLLPLLDRFDEQPPHVRAVARELDRAWRARADDEPGQDHDGEVAGRRARVAEPGVRGTAERCAVPGLRDSPGRVGSDPLASRASSADTDRRTDVALPDDVARRAGLATGPRRSADGEAGLRRALFAGYGDRLARRRDTMSDRFVLASGHGAVLGRESDVRSAEFVVALEVTAADRSGAAEARIRMASAVDRDWIAPTDARVEHRFDEATGRVRAADVHRYQSIVLREVPVPADPMERMHLLRDAWLSRPRREQDEQLLRRLSFAGVDVDLADLVLDAAARVESLHDIELETALPHEWARRLAAEAPERLPVPSGRTAPLEYAADGTVSAAVKLQELFGLAQTPLLGPRRVPVTFELLAPNGRPVQTTRDLKSFWERTYPEVRKELRGRYPKHPWPENPWTAPPTHRTTRRS